MAQKLKEQLKDDIEAMMSGASTEGGDPLPKTLKKAKAPRKKAIPSGDGDANPKSSTKRGRKPRDGQSEEIEMDESPTKKPKVEVKEENEADFETL